MPEATDFSIKVTSDDPKKKEEPSKEEGSSKLATSAKNGKQDEKEGEGDELVRFLHVEMLLF